MKKMSKLKILFLTLVLCLFSLIVLPNTFAIYKQVLSTIVYLNIDDPTGIVITFNPQNGDSNTLILRDYGEKIGPITYPTKTGEIFDGWYTLPSGGTKVNGNTLATTDVTYYAHYNPIVCSPATTLHTESNVTYGTIPNSSHLAPGFAYNCDVNGDGTFSESDERFYYLTDDENGNALFIYSNNTHEGTAACGATAVLYNNDRTSNLLPTNAYLELPSTSQWSNVSLHNLPRQIITELGNTTNDQGSIATFSYMGKAARFVTTQELDRACNITIQNGGTNTVPSTCLFLRENSSYKTSSCRSNYWTETPSDADNNVFRVSGRNGVIETTNLNPSDQTKGFSGVRPLIEVPKGSVELYGNPKKYNIAFDSQGGSSVESYDILEGDELGELTASTKSHYTFIGWYTEASGGTEVGEHTVPTGDVTYYAHWESIGQYTVKFDSQGGSSVEDMEVYANEEIGELPTTTKSGMVFAGWYTEASGGTLVTEQTIIDEQKNFYAHWNPFVCKRARTEQLHTALCDQTSGNGCIRYYSNGDTITYGNSTITAGTLNYGDAFDCDVNNDGIYDDVSERFYYVGNNGSNSSLIYYANIENDGTDITAPSQSNFAYDSTLENWHGPASGYTTLPSTTQWSNPNLNLPGARSVTNSVGTTTTLNGTNTIDGLTYTNKAARLLTNQELVSACDAGTSTNNGYLDNCYYLMENIGLYESTTGSSGYWLENPSATTADTALTVLGISGNVDDDLVNANTYGIRPVIDLPTKYIDTTQRGLDEYVITFDSEGGSAVSNMYIPQGDALGDLTPYPTKQDMYFAGWFTDDENYTTRVTSETIPEGNVTYYAKWIASAEVAIDGICYDTVENALLDVPTDNTLTTITFLKNVSRTAAIAINANKNVVFDIQNYTLSNGTTNVIAVNANGKLKIISGIVLCTTSQGAINVNSSGRLEITGGNIEATGGKQAVYNNGGTTIISGTAILTSSSNNRAAVHNLNNGTVTILGGTITSTGCYAVYNQSGTLTIGEKDDLHDITSPVIQGQTYGVIAVSEYSFYDGIIKGKTNPIGIASGSTPTITNDSTSSKIKNTEDNMTEVREEQSPYYVLYYSDGIPVTVSLTPKLNMVYTGSAIEANTATVTLEGNDTYSGSITYTYYTDGSCTTGATTTAPTSVGNYYVKATTEMFDSYAPGESSCVPHTIAKSDTTTTLSSVTNTYNGNPQVVTGAVSTLNSNNSTITDGEYTYIYYEGTSCDGIALASAPTVAGTYRVKATLAGTDNYNSSTSSCTVYTIEPNIVTITVNKDGSAWSSSGVNVALYQNETQVYGYSSATASGATVTFNTITSGTYDLYVSRDENHLTTLVDSSVDVVVTTTGSATIDYYTLTMTGTNATVELNGSSVTSGDSVAVLGNVEQEISATVASGYVVWSKISGTATFAKETSATTTVTVSAASEINATKNNGYTITFINDGETYAEENTLPNTTLGEDMPTDPTKTGYIFVGWFVDDDIDEQFDSTTEVSSDLSVYAKWTANTNVARIGGTYYSTLNSAFGAAATDGSVTEVIILKDFTVANNERPTVSSNQNVVIIAGNHTITCGNKNIVYNNNGTVTIKDGTYTCGSSGVAPLENNTSGKMYVTGGIIEATRTDDNGRAAVYNGGSLYISGDARLTSGASKRPTIHNYSGSSRVYMSGGTVRQSHESTINGAIQNLASSAKIYITGGTVISNSTSNGSGALINYSGGTIEIGSVDGSHSTTSPIILGKSYGVNSAIDFSFYDGKIGGVTAAVSDTSKIANHEDGLVMNNSTTETIESTTYNMLYYEESVASNTPTVTLTSKSNMVYTGSAIEANEATVTLSGNDTFNGSITYTYYTDSSCTTGATTTAPTNAGNYYVKATTEAFTGYSSGESSCVAHTIAKSDTTTTLANITETYTGSGISASGATSTLSSNNSTISNGTYTYTYYSGNSCSGTALASAPKAVGNYSVTATLTSTSNYNSSTSSCAAFTIEVSTLICRKATVLNEVACGQTGSNGCKGNAATSTTITYGTIPNSSTLSPGFAYDCKVTSSGSYDKRFYYLRTITDDSVQKAVLVFNDNFEGEDGIAHGNTFEYDTALTKLPTTEQWDNLPTTYEYDSVNYAARLMTRQDLYAACGSSPLTAAGSLDACYYVLENSRFESGSSGRSAGWLEKENGTLYRIYSTSREIQTPSSNTSSNYVRPVIEVPLNLIDTSVVELDTPTVTLTSKSNMVYTGSAIEANEATVTLSGNDTFNGSITYTYYTDSSCTTGATTTAPTNAGNYYVKATTEAFTGYSSGESSCVAHTIAKSDTSTTLANITETYTGSGISASGATSTLSSNNSTISNGTYTYTYYSGNSCSGTALGSAPTAVGNYSVTATLTSTSNYNSSTSSCATLTVAQAEYTITLIPNGGTLTSSTITVTEGDQVGTLETPKKGVYTFDGWYVDSEFTTPVLTTRIPTQNELYYAKWIFVASNTPVNFNMDNDAMATYFANISTWKNYEESTFKSTMSSNFTNYNCSSCNATNSCNSPLAGTYCDRPKGYETAVDDTLIVYTYDTTTGVRSENPITYTTSTNGTIYNMIPGVTYYWVASNDSSIYGYVTASGSRRTIESGSALRNVRDLGGLKVDTDNDGVADGTIKYGKLFRGAQLATGTSGDNDVASLVKLGVTREIDLRADSEGKNNGQKYLSVYDITASSNPLLYSTAEDVVITNYIINPVATTYISTPHPTEYAALKKYMKAVMKYIAYGDDSIYFHCTIGTDRTGTMAYFLEGLLGVSLEDRIEDYELTYFYGLTNRDRYHDYLQGSSISPRFTSMYKSYSTYQEIYDFYTYGDTQAEKEEADQLLADFRAAMIDGS